MKKKSISFVVTVCLMVGLLATPVTASAASCHDYGWGTGAKTSCQQVVKKCQPVKQYQTAKKCQPVKPYQGKRYYCSNRLFYCVRPSLENAPCKYWNGCTLSGTNQGNQNSGSVQIPEQNPGLPGNSGNSGSSQKPDTNVTKPDSGSSVVSDAASQVADLVNKERAKEGLGDLTLDKELSQAAEVKARDMAENGYFDHLSPTYGTPSQLLDELGISYTAMGENIAKGYLTAETVMDGWMNSSGHRANILKSVYTKIGVACVEDEKGTHYWVQLFAK